MCGHDNNLVAADFFRRVVSFIDFTNIKCVVEPTDLVAIHMRGRPWSAKEEDVRKFYKGTKFIEDSIKFGKNLQN